MRIYYWSLHKNTYFNKLSSGTCLNSQFSKPIFTGTVVRYQYRNRYWNHNSGPGSYCKPYLKFGITKLPARWLLRLRLCVKHLYTRSVMESGKWSLVSSNSLDRQLLLLLNLFVLLKSICIQFTNFAGLCWILSCEFLYNLTNFLPSLCSQVCYIY